MIITAVKEYTVPYPQRFLPSNRKPRELEMLGLIPYHTIAFAILHRGVLRAQLPGTTPQLCWPPKCCDKTHEGQGHIET